MRCLYCGKGLAFLKRLTGGGDFCSDAHRQKYQEEYNQLALSRLLQSQNRSEEKAGRKTIRKEEPAPPAEAIAAPVQSETRAAAAPLSTPDPDVTPEKAPETPPQSAAESAPEPVPELVAAAPAETVEPEPVPEAPPPAPAAGYLAAAFTPARVGPAAPSAAGGAMPAEPGSPELPRRGQRAAVSVPEADLPLACAVQWQPEIRVAEVLAAPRQPGFDLREFVHSAETPSLRLGPLAVALPDAGHEELDVEQTGFTPGSAASLWTAAGPPFVPLGIIHGGLARLEFAHTSFDELKGTEPPAPAAPATVTQLPLSGPAPAGGKPPAPPPQHIHPARVEPVMMASRTVLAPEPVMKRPVEAASEPTHTAQPGVSPPGVPPQPPYPQAHSQGQQPVRRTRPPSGLPSAPISQVRNFPIPMGIVFVPHSSYGVGPPAAAPHAHAQPPLAPPAPSSSGAVPPFKQPFEQPFEQPEAAHGELPGTLGGPPPETPGTEADLLYEDPDQGYPMHIEQIVVGDDGALLGTGPLTPQAPPSQAWQPPALQAPTGAPPSWETAGPPSPPAVARGWQAPGPRRAAGPELGSPPRPPRGPEAERAAGSPPAWDAGEQGQPSPPPPALEWPAPGTQEALGRQVVPPSNVQRGPEPQALAGPPAAWGPETATREVAHGQVPEQATAARIPERVTRSLPVTLHGMAGNRPRAALVFLKLLRGDLAPQAPPSNGLPLRPTLVLGPAPAPAAEESVSSQAAETAELASQETHTESGKTGKSRRGAKSRRTDVRVLTPEEVAGDSAEEKPAARPAAKPETLQPAAAASSESKPEPRVQEIPRPVPASPADLDLGLPKLRLGASEARWSRLPKVVKIGLAAAVIAAISLLVYLVLSGGRASASQSSAAVPSAGYEVGLPIPGDGAPKITLPRGAPNPRNYYAAKRETIEPGPGPALAPGPAGAEEIRETRTWRKARNTYSS